MTFTLQSRQWRQLRKAVLARDSWTCQLAGPACEVNAVEVDHILPRSLGGSHDVSNLRSVCHRCHRARRLVEAPW